MKKALIFAASSAAIMLTSGTSTQAQMSALKAADAVADGQSSVVHKVKRRRGRNAAIAAGVAIGVLGIAAAAANASDRNRRISRHERRCNRWRRWCRNGEREACWKFDNRC